jgi:hypothetical protein
MSPSKRAKPRRPRRPGPSARRLETTGGGETTGLLNERLSHPETSPLLSGGDLDADWARAQSSGEEAVGGTVTTPDQDVVDEIGRALGVEQASDAEVQTSGEILEARDRHYWHLERRAVDKDDA